LLHYVLQDTALLRCQMRLASITQYSQLLLQLLQKQRFAPPWPDWLVAALIGTLGLSATFSVVKHARRELAIAVGAAHVHHHAGHSH